jgi:hypothetical protein
MAKNAYRVLKKIKKRLWGSRSAERADGDKQKLKRFWRDILQAPGSQWDMARAAAAGGPRVLIATTITDNTVVAPIETALGVALTLRGAEVHYLVCDEFLPACWKPTSTLYDDLTEFAASGPQNLCGRCFDVGIRSIEALQLTTHRHSAYVTPEEYRRAEDLSRTIDLDAIRDYRLNGMAVGEHAYAGALRFFAKGNLDDEPQAEGVVRRFFHAALVTVAALNRLLDKLAFDSALFFHGIYVPEGLIGEVARRKGVHVVNWLNAYRQQCFIFSHDDTYHHTMMSEPTALWEDMQWTPAVETQLMDYLVSRWDGSRDWISFNRNPESDLQTIARETGVDFNKPCIGMLTNVMWDAQLHYPANIFLNMLEWVIATIAHFAGRPELQLLLRVHPAEQTGYIPSRQPIVAEIAKAFPNLPPNVFLIPPESKISTYAAMLQCDSVLIYGTKTGVELTSMGVPVIVAGEAWIKNKNLTLDPDSRNAYYAMLGRLPLGKRLTAEQVRRARQYAYHFFFRRMIPLEFIYNVSRIQYEVRLDALDQLRPGNFRGLDTICDGILKRRDFVYPAEHFLAHMPDDGAA